MRLAVILLLAFRLALPGYEFSFPRDHGSHPEYRTEWWYYTGHLRTESGKRYGFEVTFFRVGVVAPDANSIPKATNWDLQQVPVRRLGDANRIRRYYADAEEHNSALVANNSIGRAHG